MQWIEAQKYNGMPCFDCEEYRISVNVGGERGYPWVVAGPHGMSRVYETLEKAKAACHEHKEWREFTKKAGVTEPPD